MGDFSLLENGKVKRNLYTVYEVITKSGICEIKKISKYFDQKYVLLICK